MNKIIKGQNGLELIPGYIKPSLAKSMQDRDNTVEQEVKDSIKRRKQEEMIDKLKDIGRVIRILPKSVASQANIELANKLLSNIDLSNIDFSKMDSKPRVRNLGYITPFSPYERTRIIKNGSKI